jgi:glycosyltransferase involved in cell wall biosynthesis
VYLAKQGHEVHYISTKPGSVSRKKKQDGVEVEYHRLIENSLASLCKIQKFDTFSLTCLGSLLKNKYDIVQTTFPMDAFAASIYKSVRGTPFVHYMFDRFYPRYYITRYGKLVFKRCIRTASRIGTISNFIRNDLNEKFGIEGVVIPGTVDIEQFTLCKDKDFNTPYILSTSSLQEPRKRIDLLVKAFERLLTYMPNAVLVLSGHTVPERTRTLLESVSPKTRKAIEIPGVGRREDLPGLYRKAAISVLPSVNEAFGLVILESFASGTPVVGTRSGGIPEILNDPKTGVLFEEGDGPEELSKALLKGLELSRDPETWIRCRQHAEQYSWSKIGPKYEKLYSGVLDAGQPKKTWINKIKMEGKKIPLHSESRGEHLKSRSGYKSLNSHFDDALDELDIDYDNYYRLDLYKPFCSYIAGWLLNNGIREGTILVIGSVMFPWKIFLEKYGFLVREIEVTRNLNPYREVENQMRISDLHALKNISGNYDVIICDDIIQYAEYPGRILQIMRDKLKYGGKFLLATENVADGKARLHLLRGNNIYPDLEAELHGETTLTEIQKRPAVYRRYILGEVEKLMSESGFTVSQSNYIIKNKAIEGSLFPTPLFQYFYKNIYNSMQKIFPRLRSHIFISAIKNSVP